METDQTWVVALVSAALLAMVVGAAAPDRWPLRLRVTLQICGLIVLGAMLAWM